MESFLTKRLKTVPQKTARCWAHVEDVAAAHIAVIEASTTLRPEQRWHTPLHKRIGTWPLGDIPLEKLRHYEGRNRRPSDMEEYGEAPLTEMRGTDPQVQLVPHPLKSHFADCFPLYFTG